LGKIEHHILNEAVNQVKAITGAISEKLRFRAFVCACLNQRALLLWLNSLVSNDPLLKRYYCEGAFIRQCRSALQGLYADLTTHIEQLLNYPFSFDLAAEAKRPIGYTPPGSTHHGAKNDSTNANKTISSNATRKNGQEFKEVRTPFKFLEDVSLEGRSS
uniref:RUN domain-containing protein n=1 Tax=Hymenolepis diminuta TaxID=6216 RepID=A0A0R3SKB2_HYMDI